MRGRGEERHPTGFVIGIGRHLFALYDVPQAFGLCLHSFLHDRRCALRLWKLDTERETEFGRRYRNTPADAFHEGAHERQADAGVA